MFVFAYNKAEAAGYTMSRLVWQDAQPRRWGLFSGSLLWYGNRAKQYNPTCQTHRYKVCERRPEARFVKTV